MKTTTYYGSTVTSCMHYLETLTKMGTCSIISWNISHIESEDGIYKIVVSYKRNN